MSHRYKKLDYRVAVQNLHRIYGLLIDKDIPFVVNVVSVAHSGMSRVLKVYTIKDDKLYFIAEGRVYGCGMDMVYDTVDNTMQFTFKKTADQANIARI